MVLRLSFRLRGSARSGDVFDLAVEDAVFAASDESASLAMNQGTLLSELSQREQAQQIGYVLQSPENQVVTEKVWHELAFGLESLGYDTPTIRRRVAEIAAFFGIENWFYKNVTELSGGQKQLLSLASVMAMQPGVLLLDEPTKGFDAEFKVTFALILRRLVARGVTILMVSHDVPFCAEFSHKCGLFFDGSIVAEGTPREFFSGNSFYTTPANRMSRHLIPEAVTVADIIGFLASVCFRKGLLRRSPDVQFPNAQLGNAESLLCVRPSHGSDLCRRNGNLHPDRR